MIFGLFGRRTTDRTLALYRAIVTEARRPDFYLHHGVPDTVTARFDMMVLHVAVVLHRLRAEPESPGSADLHPRDRGQDLVDLFFAEMDRSLREMGIGDLGIPKRMKKLAAAWNGRFLAYDAALAARDGEALTAAIARNVYAEEPNRDGAAALAAHALAVTEALAAVPVADVVAAAFAWPPPPAPISSEDRP